jgi:hypothetical protein
MPCDNVTELMRVVIDHDDRLKSYRLLKRTCGGAVGAESLLLERFQGRAVPELLALRADTFCSDNIVESDVEEFLSLKHFFALKSVLEAFTGSQPAGRDSACTVSGISYDSDGATIDAEIAVGIVTEMIQSCGHCGGG